MGVLYGQISPQFLIQIFFEFGFIIVLISAYVFLYNPEISSYKLSYILA